MVINSAFHLCDPGLTLGPGIVCGLSFSRSQPDSEVFLRVLRFSSLSKIDSQPIPSGCAAVLRGHPWVVFRSRAPSQQHSSFGPISLSRALSNSVSDCEKGRLAGHVLLLLKIQLGPDPSNPPFHHGRTSKTALDLFNLGTLALFFVLLWHC